MNPVIPRCLISSPEIPRPEPVTRVCNGEWGRHSCLPLLFSHPGNPNARGQECPRHVSGLLPHQWGRHSCLPSGAPRKSRLGAIKPLRMSRQGTTSALV